MDEMIKVQKTEERIITACSQWKYIINKNLQQSLSETVLFTIFINNLGRVIWKSADNTNSNKDKE